MMPEGSRLYRTERQAVVYRFLELSTHTSRGKEVIGWLYGLHHLQSFPCIFNPSIFFFILVQFPFVATRQHQFLLNLACAYCFTEEKKYHLFLLRVSIKFCLKVASPLRH